MSPSTRTLRTGVFHPTVRCPARTEHWRGSCFTATGFDSKVWEQLDYFYEVDAWLPRNTVFANKDAFEALPDEQRQALTDCAAEAAERGLQMAQDYTGTTLKGLADNGINVEKPTEQLVSDLQAFGEMMTEEWLESAGESGKAIIDDYRSM